MHTFRPDGDQDPAGEEEAKEGLNFIHGRKKKLYKKYFVNSELRDSENFLYICP